MNMQDYEELFGEYKGVETEENLDKDCVISFATKEECSEISKKHEKEKTKKVKVLFELGEDIAALELCVESNWTDKKILNYIKKNMWLSVEEL